jgi:hypothetical protein
MANGDPNYWEERYKQEVLGHPKPKETIVTWGFSTVEEIAADTMKTMRKIFEKQSTKQRDKK